MRAVGNSGETPVKVPEVLMEADALPSTPPPSDEMRALVENYVQSNLEEFDVPPETPAPLKSRVCVSSRAVGSPATPRTPRSVRRGKGKGSKASTPLSSVKKSKKNKKHNMAKVRRFPYLKSETLCLSWRQSFTTVLAFGLCLWLLAVCDDCPQPLIRSARETVTPVRSPSMLRWPNADEHTDLRWV
jgi:hypothetical protein